MRILIDQLGEMNAEHIRTALELQKEHEIVYWIRIEGFVTLDKNLFPKTIFHNYLDAVKNIPPKEVDASKFEPWSREEIVSYSQWESELLSMMDKGHSTWPVDKRKDFYYELLRYWGGIVDKYSPDLIVFNAPPHQVFNFVLYAIAKQRGVRTLVFDLAVRQDRIIAASDYRTGNEVLAHAQSEGYGDAPVTLSDLPSYLQDHYRSVSGTPNPTPEHLVEFKQATAPLKNLYRRVQSLAPHVKDGTIFERGVRRFVNMSKPRLKDVYQELQRAPDFQRPYVYMALHYQPECTTSPQGGIYVDQILMIQTLAAALPLGWEIYVKEHPAQWPSHWGDYTAQRYRGYYEHVASIPHVRIVPITTSTFMLSDHARATATASGTAAWESVVRGRPALIFGYPWFMHAPGIFRVSSVADCRATFQKIKDGYVPQKDQLMRYLALVGKVAFAGTLGVSADQVKDSEGEQWKSMYDQITAALAAPKTS